VIRKTKHVILIINAPDAQVFFQLKPNLTVQWLSGIFVILDIISLKK